MSHTLFQDISQEQFLKEYWQKKPYLFKSAYTFDDPLIDGDDLAYLACDDNIESRFVFTDSQETDWKVEHGPFEENRFESLPDKNWTLMVQSVDQWVPELYELLKGYDFLPGWRIDDILATYATEGGGVGPHFDYYDVFLIQASGQRRWKIGQYCDSQSTLRENSDIKLLKHFGQVDDYVLSPGDVLYIPPHIAHWGTAVSDDCMTLSVGFRAPSEADLISDALAQIDALSSEDQRYKDDTTSPLTTSGEITSGNKRQVRQLIQDYLIKLGNDETFLTHIEDIFAKQVTSPRNLNIIEPEDDIDPQATILRAIANKHSIFVELDAVCRAAFDDKHDGSAKLYFNGECYEVATAFASGVCGGEIPVTAMANDTEVALLIDWATRGFIYVATGE